MNRSVRRSLLALAGVLGLVAATAGPAAAMISVNHTEPLTGRR